MKKVILLTLWNLALSAPMFYLISCGPSKEEVEAREKQALTAASKKYKVGQIVYLKPDSCKGLVLGYTSKYWFNATENPVEIYYLMRDCRGKEVVIKSDNFIYGLEN